MDTTIDFNKGKALLNATLITFGIILGLFLFAIFTGISGKILWFVIGIGTLIYCKKNDIKYEKNISNNAWVYFILILFFGEIGSILFFYEIQKVKAKKEGKNIDTPKGKLFIALYSVLVLLFLSILIIGGISGYNAAMDKYNQKEINLQKLENELPR